MIEAFLVSENTVATAKGDGPALDLAAATTRVFLLNLAITNIVEQEALDVSIQTFYRGETPLLLDLTSKPEVKAIRAHWDVGRWGRGSETPMFEFCVTLREVPQEIITATASHVSAR